MNNLKSCPVCGGESFSCKNVLWDELIEDWALEQHEVKYVNEQQGKSCDQCGNNLRAMALAFAVLKSYKYEGTLKAFTLEASSKNLRILEINPAGALTHVFQTLQGHKLTAYPEYDIENLNIESSSYDMVVHSDTLEHIANPVVALAECKRVLRPNGKCIFTVPIIIDRLSKSREGMKSSYHGSEGSETEDLIVHTEFGSDVWKYIIQAGFTMVAFHCLNYPAGLAIEAK